MYGAIKGVISPFHRGVKLIGAKRIFNNWISSIRISVEQAFGATQQKRIANAFETQIKAGLQLVTAYYLISVLLTNYYTCI